VRVVVFYAARVRLAALLQPLHRFLDDTWAVDTGLRGP
jgi:hypothetical protein